MAHTADEIGNRQFSITQRGYDRGEVDAYLREIARQIDEEQLGSDEDASRDRTNTMIDRLAELVTRLERLNLAPATTDLAPVTSEAAHAASPSLTPPRPTREVVTTAPKPSPKPVPALKPVPEPEPAPEPESVPEPEPVPRVTAAGVSDGLDEAKNLLDGVLDDVMGSLRTER